MAELPVNATATLPIVRAGELFGTFSSVPAIGAQLGFGVLFHGIEYDYNHDEVLVSLTARPGRRLQPGRRRRRRATC